VTGRFTVPDNEPAQKSFHEAAQKIREVNATRTSAQPPSAHARPKPSGHPRRPFH
jgi:hypothetical protein